LGALIVFAWLPACGNDSSSGTTMTVTSGGAAAGSGGSSTGSGGNTGGNGGAGAASGAGGTSGSGGGEPRDGALDGDDSDSGFVSCALPTDPVDFYEPNLTKLGKNGTLTFRLVESDIVPPGLGVDTWIVKVMRADGGVVSGDLAGHVAMPNHTHPVTVQPEPAFDADKGAYVVTPLYFFLAGYWRSTFAAYDGSADAGPPLDTVDFNFCVQ
jgi:hypothetical protein